MFPPPIAWAIGCHICFRLIRPFVRACVAVEAFSDRLAVDLNSFILVSQCNLYCIYYFCRFVSGLCHADNV